MFKNAVNKACEKALRAIAEGDKSSLEVIYDKLHKLIYSVAWSVLKNHEDAEDILQNTLCEILRAAPSYRGGNARAWVLSIARNQAFNLARRKGHETVSENIPEPESQTDDNAVESEYIYLEALATLGAREREVVVLKIYCGLKHKEIAEILEITPSAAEKLYQRGIAKLRVYYK